MNGSKVSVTHTAERKGGWNLWLVWRKKVIYFTVWSKKGRKIKKLVRCTRGAIKSHKKIKGTAGW